MVSGVKIISWKRSHGKTYKEIMASEQIKSEAITKAVAKATKIALETMAEAQVERMHGGSGPKVGSPTMKQPTFHWNVQDKYSELKTY